mgnify:FL=1
MPAVKPADIAADPYRSQLWDDLSQSIRLMPQHVPLLEVLVNLLAAARQSTSDLMYDGSFEVIQGDRVNPSLKALLDTSAEIRQLTKQLGITASEEPAMGIVEKSGEVTPLEKARRKRQQRMKQAASE